MTMQAQEEGHKGLGALALIMKVRRGLGIQGPFGANPQQVVPADNYEITGTQVALRDQPGGNEVGRFNNDYGPNNDIVVGTPDQVAFDGQTGSAEGLTWAHVSVSSGKLQGKSGYVAIEYMGPIGYTASKGKVAPSPSPTPSPNNGGGQNVNLPDSSASSATDYTPYVLAGVAVVGIGIIGLAVMHHKKKGHKHAHA